MSSGSSSSSSSGPGPILKRELALFHNFPWFADAIINNKLSCPDDVQGLLNIIHRSEQDLFSGDPDLQLVLEVLQSPHSLSKLLKRHRPSCLQWVINYLFYYRALDVAQFFSSSHSDIPITHTKDQHLELSLKVSFSKFHRAFY
jgi:hypothetical protein